MLEIFDRSLSAKYGVTTALCGSTSGAFVYLDDVMFSGNRVRTDLEKWIKTGRFATLCG